MRLIKWCMVLSKDWVTGVIERFPCGKSFPVTPSCDTTKTGEVSSKPEKPGQIVVRFFVQLTRFTYVQIPRETGVLKGKSGKKFQIRAKSEALVFGGDI